MDIESRVKDIIFGLSNSDKFENDSTLKEDLALDSILMVTLLIEVEEVFGIELDESDMNPFDLSTVQDIIQLVKKYCEDN